MGEEATFKNIMTADDARVVCTLHGYASAWKRALRRAEEIGYYFALDGIQGDTVSKTYIGSNKRISSCLEKNGYKRMELAEGVYLNPYNRFNEGKLYKDGNLWKLVSPV